MIEKDGMIGGPAPEPAPNLAAIDAYLAQLALASSTRKAPSIVRQRLLAEMRSRAEREFLRWPGFTGRRWTRPLAGGIALLAALLVVGGLLSSPGKLTTAVHSAMLSFTQWRDARLHPGSSPAAGDTEIADTEDSFAASSDTFAVPYSDPSISNQTGATLRVSLPDSELLAWGVPSLAREPDDLVPVDLILGDDGLPRAVRLLPATASAPEVNYP